MLTRRTERGEGSELEERRRESGKGAEVAISVNGVARVLKT